MRITPIDDKKANDGEIFNYMGVPLRIARANNDNFKRVFRQLTKPYQRDIDKGTLDNDTAEDILCKALAQTVLLGWDETKFPGNYPYSVDNAESLLKNDIDCRNFVTEVSQGAENFYVVNREEFKGN